MMKTKFSILLVAVCILLGGAVNAQVPNRHHPTLKKNDVSNNASCIQNVTSSKCPKATLLNVDFEDGVFVPTGWTLISTAPTTWTLDDYFPITGNNSTTCYYDESSAAQNEKLISPVVDLTSAATLSFTWVGSYDWSVLNDNCDLDVYVSTNGGATWGASPIWSEPTTVWENWSVFTETVDLSVFSGQANCKLSFVYTGTDGADFSVDDILLTNSVGINNFNKQSSAINVYPIPASKVLNIVADNNQIIQTLKVLNMNGQLVEEMIVDNNKAELNVSNYTAGIYFVQISTEKGISTKKFTITK
jgi:hypothetical protein